MFKLIKPGTIALIFVGLVLAYGGYQWADSSFERVTERSDQRQEHAVECSSLTIDFVSIDSNYTHTTAFLMPNRALNRMYLLFEGESENHTEVVKDVPAGRLVEFTAPVNDTVSMYAGTGSCDRRYRSS